MFDVKDCICLEEKPPKPCEDSVGYGDNYCFVIDGASGLSGIQIVDEESDAAWFARKIKEKLCSRLDHDNETPTDIILEEIVRDLNEVYCHTAEEKGMEVPEDSPSAGIVLFRKMKDQIVFYGLGDCTGVVQLANGTVDILKDNGLCSLDGSVLKKMEELHRETGISVLEARTECNDMLLANRSRRNKEDGYWILDLSGIGIAHARTDFWPEDSVKTFFACSDGFAQLTDTFGLYGDYTALLEAVQHMPLSKLCDALFSAQNQDPQANMYPRFKLRDDTSCLWGNIVL